MLVTPPFIHAACLDQNIRSTCPCLRPPSLRCVTLVTLTLICCVVSRRTLGDVRNLTMERYLTLTNTESSQPNPNSMEKYRRWKQTLADKKAAQARREHKYRRAS